MSTSSKAATLAIAMGLALALAPSLSPISSAAPASDPTSGRESAEVPGVRAGYVWPLSPRPRVARPFEAPPFKYGRGHRGADLAGLPGQAVLAAGPGVVVFSGQVAGRPVVSIDHAGGLRTTYEPVAGTVQPGVAVRAGDPIGTLQPGHLDCGQPACLHWGLRRGEDYIDPLTLVRPAVIRLKPVGAPGRAPPAAAPR